MMNFLAPIMTFFAYLLLFFLVLPFFLVFIWGIYKIFKKKQYAATIIPNLSFAHIITAYKNAALAEPLVASLQRQTTGQQHIYLVADAVETPTQLKTLPGLSVLYPSKPLHLKIRSVMWAVEQFVNTPDVIVIWDADNLAHPDFQAHIQSFFAQGFKAVQGQRTAKNLDTPIAAADALGEFYKNFVERLVPAALGSSAVISGSGMAVATPLYLDYLRSSAIAEGHLLGKKMMQEDKILQNHLVNRNIRIAYAADAICYDEKVRQAEAVETQRSRWLFSYFQNTKNALRLIITGLSTLNYHKFLFGVVTISPPLFILVGLSGLWVVFMLLAQSFLAYALMAGIVIFTLNIFLTLYLSHAPRAVYKAISILPLFIIKQAKGLLKMVNPDKNFTATDNNHKMSIDDVLHKGK